jgi:hypothetical protein
MSPLAALSMAAVGNTMILLLASPSLLTTTTSGVHALQMARHPCRLILPESYYSPHATNIFGALHHKRRRHVSRELHSTGDDNSNNGNAVDEEVVNQPSSSSASSPSTSSSFLRALDNFGMKLKPWALSAQSKSLTYSNNETGINGNDVAITATGKFKSVLCKLQADVLWVLYILYRGYRGFFVILPAVFREVYRKLEESDLVVDVYGDEEIEEKEYAVNANAGGGLQPRQLREPMRLRTRITISMLSAMLTLSYVVSGALRVLGEFLRYHTALYSSLNCPFKQFSRPVLHTHPSHAHIQGNSSKPSRILHRSNHR